MAINIRFMFPVEVNGHIEFVQGPIIANVQLMPAAERCDALLTRAGFDPNVIVGHRFAPEWIAIPENDEIQVTFGHRNASTAAMLLCSAAKAYSAYCGRRNNFSETENVTLALIFISALMLFRNGARVALPAGAEADEISFMLNTGFDHMNPACRLSVRVFYDEHLGELSKAYAEASVLRR